MRYRPIQAASRERVPFKLWGASRARTALAAVAASAAALVPTIMVASPAHAAAADYLTISAGAGWEGAAIAFNLTYTGTTSAVFTLSTADTSGSANPAAAGNTLVSGAGDFVNDSFNVNGTAAQTTVVFPASSAGNPTTATVAVTTYQDADTADEEFRLNATNTTLGGVTGDNSVKSAYGTVWAHSSNTYPEFTLKGPTAAVAETATGGVQKPVTITATLAAVMTHPVTIPVATINGTATSIGGDFRDYTALPPDAAITIPAYSYTGTTDVTLFDDSLYETASQAFTVQSGVVSYGPQPTGGPQIVTVTVTDDDPKPTVSIADAPAATEADYLSFPVKLSGLSELQVQTTASTGDGIVRQDSNAATGTGGSADYTPQAGATVTIAPYTLSRVFSVATTSAGGFEGPENLKVTLSGTPTNATLGTPTTAYGVINDGTAAPVVTLSTTGKEGNSAPSGSSFVELASGETVRKIGITGIGGVGQYGPWAIPVKIDYAFKDGTATNGVDYKGTAGSITIPAGSTATTLEIPVTIVGDTIKEGVDPGNGDPFYETFDVVLTSTTGTITEGTTTLKITEGTEDVTPTWSVGNVSVPEGNTGTVTAKFPVMLSAPAATDTAFSIALTDGTATETGVNSGTTVGANDYDWPADRTVTIPAGSTTGWVEIPINSDTVHERDETLVVTPTQTTSGSVSDTPAVGTVQSAALTITNDDAKPSITFNNLTGTEGSLLRVNGTINGLSQYEYKLGFATAASNPDPATANKDYDAPANLANWSLTVPRGTTGALTEVAGTPFTFDVYLTPDTIDEATESFTLTATETTPSPTGFTTSVGTYSITDDTADMPPAASIRDESIGEDEGSVDVHVDLTQVGATTGTEQTINVPYTTVDGSAKAGQDYATTKGTLSIDPGVTSTYIKVPIINDKLSEGGENFWVKLGTPTSPAGATIAKSAGEVIIKANDGGSGETPGGEEPGGEEPGGEEPGGLTLSGPASVVGAVAVPLSGKAEAGAKVELWGAPMAATDADLVKIMETTAGSDGSYKFLRWIGQGYRFAAKVGDEMSDEVEVIVQQRPILVASSPSRGKLSLAVQGNPRGPNQTVIVQRWAGGKWVNAWRGTTASNNIWRATVAVPAGSTQTVRAFIAGYTASGLRPGYTVARKVTIK
jgi:hypothetical protein